VIIKVGVEDLQNIQVEWDMFTGFGKPTLLHSELSLLLSPIESLTPIDSRDQESKINIYSTAGVTNRKKTRNNKT
jgi:hypothetical protein